MDQNLTETGRESRDISVNVNVNVPAQAAAHQEVNKESQEVYKEGLGYGLWCLGLTGICGGHRIYMGKYGTGILWLLTFGLLGVGQIIDLFRMKSLIRDSNFRSGSVPHPKLAAQAATGSAPAPVKGLRKPADLRLELLQAALKNGGVLTVTQGVMFSGKSFEEVEACLHAMVDKGYVDVDNAPKSGVVIYRFPELARE